MIENYFVRWVFMENRIKSVCFSGHRTENLPKKTNAFLNLKNDTYNKIEELIKEGFDTFYFGACYGYDMMCAESVIELKRKYANVKLIAVVPFVGQEEKWSDDLKLQYKMILYRCNEVVILNEQYKRGCYFERNRYIVDRSSVLVCYFKPYKSGGTRYTVNYALQNNRNVINLYKK